MVRIDYEYTLIANYSHQCELLLIIIHIKLFFNTRF